MEFLGQKQAEELGIPYLTCEAVVAEASHLLRNFHRGQDRLMELIELGGLAIDFSLQREAGAVRSLISKYATVPMTLADGCLVRMSEIHESAAVFTVDSDFLIYRKHGRKRVPLICPF